MNLPGKGAPYLRLAEYMKTLILLGAFKEGDFLPTARETAETFSLNPNTVTRAYRILVKEGYIDAIDRKGYLVKRSEGEYSSRYKKLEETFSSLCKEGYTLEEISDFLTKILEEKN